MIAKNILLVLLLTLHNSGAANVLRGGRSLRPLRDIFLETLDEITRPDNEDGIDENGTTDPPTSIPSMKPFINLITLVPSIINSDVPSSIPSIIPSNTPSDVPSTIPSDVPSSKPSNVPLNIQSDLPSIGIDFDTVPTIVPSSMPSDLPSVLPSKVPSFLPSDSPSKIPSAMPTFFPSSTPSISPSAVPSDKPSILPSSVPSDAPSSIPSEVPSDSPSSIPSEIPSDSPSSVPSDVPSDSPISITSDVPSFISSSIPSDIFSSVPSRSPIASDSIVPPSSSPTLLNEEDVLLFESACAQFLYDYLPLVQPNDYSDLACTIVNQTTATGATVRRHLQEEAFVPFAINDNVMIVAVTGNAPGEANFAQVVSQTFETFGTELENTLRDTSDIFDEDGADVVSPTVPEEEVDVQPSKNSPTLDWTILASAIAGGVCLALLVSLLLVKKSRNNHSTTTIISPERNLSDVQSKSFSVSSVRDGSSFKEFNLIKLISIEASRSLQRNDDDEGEIIPPTPLGIDAVPDTLMNSPEEIKSELSPSSNFGDGFGCCRNALENSDTFDGQNITAVSTLNRNGQSQVTSYTGLSTVMMTDQESGINRDQLSSSQSDLSDLEGLKLVVSTTNTFSNFEPQERQVQTPTRRSFFKLRPTNFLHRPASATNAISRDVSMVDTGDCCGNDNWTVRTNSIITPRKTNTTSGNSMTGRSNSF